MSTPQAMDFESGPSPSQNANLKQELDFLRAEIVKIQGELIEAKKYEEKYHQVVEEVNQLRQRLRCTPPRV